VMRCELRSSVISTSFPLNPSPAVCQAPMRLQCGFLVLIEARVAVHLVLPLLGVPCKRA
jgi:hypothetical protein